MTPQEMLLNINSLGGSTRNNEHYNHGCGAKIAGLAHNRAGIYFIEVGRMVRAML